MKLTACCVATPHFTHDQDGRFKRLPVCSGVIADFNLLNCRLVVILKKQFALYFWVDGKADGLMLRLNEANRNKLARLLYFSG